MRLRTSQSDILRASNEETVFVLRFVYLQSCVQDERNPISRQRVLPKYKSLHWSVRDCFLLLKSEFRSLPANENSAREYSNVNQVSASPLIHRSAELRGFAIILINVHDAAYFRKNFAPSWLSVTQCEHGIELSVKAVKFRQPFCADSILKPADATLWMLEWLGPLCTRSVMPFGKPLAERQWTKASMMGLRDA